jgi:hypothetical protein
MHDMPLEQVTQETASPEPSDAHLVSKNDARQFRTRWSDIQASFIDEPWRAVEQADALVSDLMGQLAQNFAQTRSRLGDLRNRKSSAETEELRQVLRRYQALFDRLVRV